MLLRATTGTTTAFTSSKSEMIPTPTSKLLGGISRRAELRKISRLMLSGPDSSILPDLCPTPGDHTNPSSVPSPWESKALNNTTQLLWKTLSTITSTRATRATLRKETSQQEPYRICAITIAKPKLGDAMSSMSSKGEEKLSSHLPTLTNLKLDPPIDDLGRDYLRIYRLDRYSCSLYLLCLHKNFDFKNKTVLMHDK